MLFISLILEIFLIGIVWIDDDNLWYSLNKSFAKLFVSDSSRTLSSNSSVEFVSLSEMVLLKYKVLVHLLFDTSLTNIRVSHSLNI